MKIFSSPKLSTAFLLGISLFVLLSLPTLLHAQSDSKEIADKGAFYGVAAGPAIMYSDNAGIIRDFKFNVAPSISFFYGQKFQHPNLTWKVSAGYQRLGSANISDESLEQIWASEGQAVRFNGNAFFLDWMPMYHFSGKNEDAESTKIKFYGGLGLGFMMAFNQEVYRNLQSQNDSFSTLNKNRSTIYLPLRLGGSRQLKDDIEIGAEGSLFIGFSDKIDGNAKYNLLTDFPLQLQFFVKKRLGK